jgi:putative SOS response-associated peptidase YedK
MCEEYALETTPDNINFAAAELDLPCLPEPSVLRRTVKKSDESDVLANDGNDIRWITARLGVPKPERHQKANARVNAGIANIRHPWYPDWRNLLGTEHRCVIPATSFIEHNSVEGTYEGWEFALASYKPMFWFAGLWMEWTGVRKVDEGVRTQNLYAIITTEPNAEVRPINRSMPVIFRNREEITTWLTAPAREALRLQRPLPDATLQFIRRLWDPAGRL